MQSQVMAIIKSAIEQQTVLLEEPINLSQGDDSPLYGENATIDSITLVSILLEVEAGLREKLEIETQLADTGDLASSARPFATLGTFCAYVMQRCAAHSAKQKV